MKGLDWSNESYSRLYRRDTPDWNLLGFEGQAVYMALLRHLDRSGVLPFGKELTPVEAVSACLYGWPPEVVAAGLERLLARGYLIHSGSGLVDPEFLERDEAVKSNALKCREYRARRAENAASDTSGVESDTARHSATPTDTPSVPSVPLPCSTPTVPKKKRAPARGGGKRRPPSGKHQEVIDWWCREYEARLGTAYAVQGAKDGSAVKAMLKNAQDDVGEVQRRCANLLEAEDTWYLENRTLAVARSKWNELHIVPGTTRKKRTLSLVERMGLEGDDNGRHPGTPPPLLGTGD